MAHLNTAESRSAEGRGGAEDPGDVTSPWLNGKLELEKRRSYVLMNIWHQIVFLFFFSGFILGTICCLWLFMVVKVVVDHGIFILNGINKLQKIESNRRQSSFERSVFLEPSAFWRGPAHHSSSISPTPQSKGQIRGIPS